MKFLCAMLVVILLGSGSQMGFSQNFTDLNFERAIIKPDPSSTFYPTAVYATNAIPGWTADSFAESGDIVYNNFSLGTPNVSLVGTNDQFGIYPLDGKYGVFLQGTYFGTASIDQIGAVPVSAQSLLFIAQPGSTLYPGPLQVSLGSQDLSLVVVSNAPNYTVYGADISAFAGQTEQLTFSALGSSAGDNFWEIDDIQFSASPVPEPSALALATLSGLALGWRSRRKSSS